MYCMRRTLKVKTRKHPFQPDISIIMDRRRPMHSSLPARPTDEPVSTFPVTPTTRFERTCAAYRKPKEIATFGYDENRVMKVGDEQMKYYHPPDLTAIRCDLSAGYDTYVARDQGIDEHIDALLDSLSDLEEKKEDSRADFVCYRGIMTKIFTTPYSKTEPWELRVTKFRDTIYIEEHEGEEKRSRKNGENERHKLMSYWGYKFETYCTSPRPAHETTSRDLEEVRNSTVNTNVQHCVVFKTKLGRNSIIMGAEMDCIDGEKTSDPIPQYIELKTSKVFESDRDRYSFERYKLIKFWAQSFLPGTPRIVVGFRTEEGIVSAVQSFNTLELPRLVRGKPNMWDPGVCINFADDLLNFVRETVDARIRDSGDPEVTWTLRYRHPFREIELVYEGKKNSFLTKRFIRSMEKRPIVT